MIRRGRLTAAVAAYLAIVTGTYFVGAAHHHHNADAALALPTGVCPLQATMARDGRALVTYADDTNDARMQAAIRAAVEDWNHAAVDVELVPDSNFAALIFRAGERSSTIASCSSSAARAVAITLSAPLWSATTGPKTVVDPVGSVAKDIGRALGLPGGGKCPDLMAPKVCTLRQTSPDAHDAALINELYAARAATTP